MKVTFWGVRGSIPCPGAEYIRYGGNTACIQITYKNTIIILDAGTGIRKLGQKLATIKEPLEIHILNTHTHWDHIQGLPFFVPIFQPKNTIHLYGPYDVHRERSFSEVITYQMDFSYFPVEVIELEAKLEYHDLGRRTFRIGELQVRTHHFNHTVYMLGYRLEGAGKVLVYTGDHEPYWDFLFTGEKDLETFCEQEEVQRSIQQRNQEVTDFVRGADLLICDAQYFSLEEYEAHRGWGHSSAYHAADLAMQTEVKQLALFHHDPNRTDRQLDELEQAIKKYVTEKGYPGIDVFAAREGMEIDL